MMWPAKENPALRVKTVIPLQTFTLGPGEGWFSNTAQCVFHGRRLRLSTPDDKYLLGQIEVTDVRAGVISQFASSGEVNATCFAMHEEDRAWREEGEEPAEDGAGDEFDFIIPPGNQVRVCLRNTGKGPIRVSGLFLGEALR